MEAEIRAKKERSWKVFMIAKVLVAICEHLSVGHHRRHLAVKNKAFLSSSCVCDVGIVAARSFSRRDPFSATSGFEYLKFDWFIVIEGIKTLKCVTTDGQEGRTVRWRSGIRLSAEGQAICL